MLEPTLIYQIEEALRSEQPEQQLIALVLRMKETGADQAEIYALFESQLLRHRNSNEAFSDVLASVMDRIVGWCSPDLRLFDTALQR